jgi:hypothetical protein
VVGPDIHLLGTPGVLDGLVAAAWYLVLRLGILLGELVLTHVTLRGMCWAAA